MSIAVLASFGAGCSQIVGFRDVSLADDTTKDAGSDAPRVDAPIDTPPPKLWVFVTDAGFTGGFGVPNGSRATADIKCQDMYNLNFTMRSCTNIHAVIQIDDTVDSLARMDITFPIPQNAEVLRATDGTPVTNNWDTLVNPNAVLLAPVSAATTQVPFWSGRAGSGANLQCSNWTSASSGASGNAGDATKVNAWMSQFNFMCNNFNQHLLCICW
ncbi:MAG: hypothetical protein E6J90_23625 [Deltaproteobacteria bacterium]|nr:MAG: hypothetical protein E6J91_39135 [Deltaproteobacteria bacterium]TMQ16497.1 MAG: hypothetical protein E6J90_23625 [Deltaproteobacteria bacterium]